MRRAITSFIGRHRLAFVLGGVVFCAVEVLLGAFVPRLWLLLIYLMLLLATLALMTPEQPATFVVRADRARFESVPTAAPVLRIYSPLLLLGALVGGQRDLAETWLIVVGVVVCAIAITRVLQGPDTYLRPDGVFNRRLLGTLVIPWEAGPQARFVRKSPGLETSVFPPGAYPPGDRSWRAGSQSRMLLEVARPELVQRRGLVLGSVKILTDEVDLAFLARAVSTYADQPHRRAGIGTDAGLRELTSGAE